MPWWRWRQENPAKRLEHEDAARWVAEEIARLRALSYEELLALLDETIHEEMASRSGRVLIREWEVFWDGPPGPNLRVIVDVWDPSKYMSVGRAGQSFIRAPDGSFVGE